MSEQGADRREYIRVDTDLPVQYKLLSDDPEVNFEEIREGRAVNLSGGGAMVRCTFPRPDIIEDLIQNRVAVGLNVDLEDEKPPIKVLTRLAWVERSEADESDCIVGLRFREITRESQDRIFQYVIRSQFP